jgi:hypothetical protein
VVDHIWIAYRGAAHVIVDCCDGAIEALGFDPRGMPAREAFASAEVIGALDAVYLTGCPYAMDSPDREGNLGTVVIVPLADEQGVWGLSSLWKVLQRAAVPLASGQAVEDWEAA